jgi:hypothetical protein
MMVLTEVGGREESRSLEPHLTLERGGLTTDQQTLGPAGMTLPVKLLPSFFSYALCGGLATVFDWGSFYIASYLLHWHYLLAVTISFSLGTIVNYS